MRYWDTLGALSDGQHLQVLWRAHSDAVNTAWLAPRLPTSPVKRLLKTDLFDEAFAAGLYPTLSECAQHVVGIDVAESTLRAARARYAHVHGVAADVRRLPFAAGVFDVVVSNSTLDHFTVAGDIVTALRELHRVLHAGGQLLLTIDNLANPVVAVRNALPFRFLHALGIVPYQIGASCGPRRLEHAVRQAGFDLLEVGAILHCPRLLAVAAARVVERYGSPETRQRFLRGLLRFERLADWRSRFATGYFITIVAHKP